MDIRYFKNTERPVAEIVTEQFTLFINKPAGEYDRSLTDIKLTAGDEYTVTHNGTEYTCTAWETEGEVHIGGEDEPFDIYNYGGDIFAMAAEDGSRVFEIYHKKINKLPNDVLANGGGTGGGGASGEDIMVCRFNEDTETFDKSYAEIIEYGENDKLVYLFYDGYKLDYNGVDVTDEDVFFVCFIRYFIDVINNCVAYTFVKLYDNGDYSVDEYTYTLTPYHT